MRFSVTHQTHYHYAADVVLAYNWAHLLPRATSRQQVLSSSLHVDPTPDDRWDTSDPDGNTVTYFSLERPHRELLLTARSEVALDPLLDGATAGCAEPWDEVAARSMPALAGDAVYLFDSPL